jgi:hypothetical protein
MSGIYYIKREMFSKLREENSKSMAISNTNSLKSQSISTDIPVIRPNPNIPPPPRRKSISNKIDEQTNDDDDDDEPIKIPEKKSVKKNSLLLNSFAEKVGTIGIEMIQKMMVITKARQGEEEKETNDSSRHLHHDRKFNPLLSINTLLENDDLKNIINLI